MDSVTIQEAQASLPELIHRLGAGEEVVITEGDRAVARLLGQTAPSQKRKLGSLAGTVKYLSPDFDAPLDDFKEYME